MERITWQNLKDLADRINEVKGTPIISWTKNVKNESISAIGNYHISGAYGGARLDRMVNESGGINDVFGCGYTTKRDLWNRMRAYLEGCRKD